MNEARTRIPLFQSSQAVYKGSINITCSDLNPNLAAQFPQPSLHDFPSCMISYQLDCCGAAAGVLGPYTGDPSLTPI